MYRVQCQTKPEIKVIVQGLQTRVKKDIKQFPEFLEILCGDAYFLCHQNLAGLKDNVYPSGDLYGGSLIRRKNVFLGHGSEN